MKAKLYWQGCWRWTKQRRTCLVGAGHQQNNSPSSFFLSVFLCFGPSVSVLTFVHDIINHKIYQTVDQRLRSFINSNTTKESEWQWKLINHTDELGQKRHTHLKFSQCWFVLLLSFMFDPKNEKGWEGSHMWLIIKEMVTTNPSQNNTIDDLLYFFRSTVQMTSDETKKKRRKKPFQLLFSLESHNDPLTFLTVSFF